MNTLLARYGLKWDPFSQDVPSEALFETPAVDTFCWQVEQILLREGGFALVSGDPGLGKSATLRLLEARLARGGDAKLGVLTHASGSVSSFYRELGDLFGVELTPRNRWGGFKALRERWHEHIESTLLRPVLLVDEAQETNPKVLTELRILSSTRLDSRVILCVVLAGDRRLQDKLRSEELLALGSRLRVRLALAPAAPDDLLALLDHRLEAAGGQALLTPGLKETLVERCAGNPRILLAIGRDLLLEAARRERNLLDEKLFLEVCGAPPKTPDQRRRRRRGA